MYNRLVAFGDSFTFGHGLSDCINLNKGPGVNPSKFAWPSILSNKLNLNLDNCAFPGISNFGMLDIILSYKFKSDDLVLIMWNFYPRDMLFLEDKQKYHLHSIKGDLDKYINHWLYVHSDVDFYMRTWFYMHHAFLFLSKLKVKFYFLKLETIKQFFDLKPSWCNQITFLNSSFDNYISLPLALDNIHPGEITHKITATKIFYEIKEQLFF